MINIKFLRKTFKMKYRLIYLLTQNQMNLINVILLLIANLIIKDGNFKENYSNLEIYIINWLANMIIKCLRIFKY